MKRYAKANGYTLVELLVAMAIAGIVAGSVLGAYQVSQNIYIRATSLENAQLGARAGLDRVADELRLIGSYWFGATDAGNAIITAASNSITFMANVDDLSIAGGAEATATSATGNSVTLNLTATATADAFNVYTDTTLNDFIYIADGARREVKQITGTVIDSNTLTLAPPLRWSPYPAGSLVRDVKRITYTRNAANNTLTRAQGNSGAIALVDNVSSLTFRYFNAAGADLGATPPVANIREIQIALTVQSPDGSARLMTTRVRPRNLPS